MNGTDTLALKAIDGNVVITFQEPVSWVKLDPETARQVAEQLARDSYEARYGAKPDQKSSQLSREIMSKLLNRTTHIIRSMQEQNKMPGHIAQAVLDHILSEVM